MRVFSRLHYINNIQWLEARPFLSCRCEVLINTRGCSAVTGCVLGEAARHKKNNPALSLLMHTNRMEDKFIFYGFTGAVACLEREWTCVLCTCGKWEVNSKSGGRYLPTFLLPPGTLTAQSQDNGEETNSVLRQSNSPPLHCRCVSPRWGKKKTRGILCKCAVIAAASTGYE